MNELQQSLIEKWLPTIHKSSHIFTWSGDGELAYLAEQASKAEMAFEVGVYLGRSSKVMLDANPDLELWSIDPGLVAGVFETSAYFMREEIAQGRCHLLRYYTYEGVARLHHFAGQFDFGFLDDGHAEKDVECDINNCLPLIRKGGNLCGHDYDTNPVNDVARVVQRMLPNHTEPVPRLWCHVKTEECEPFIRTDSTLV